MTDKTTKKAEPKGPAKETALTDEQLHGVVGGSAPKRELRGDEDRQGVGGAELRQNSESVDPSQLR